MNTFRTAALAVALGLSGFGDRAWAQDDAPPAARDQLQASRLAPGPEDTLRLVTALDIAKDNNPRMLAARLKADAAEERISQAGALPDPRLSLALMNRPVDGFGTTPQMTMNSITLTQRFPWPGKLGFAEERARRLSEAERLSASEVELQLLARVKSVYYRTAYVDRAIHIMEDTRELLRGFLEVSSTRYAVGEGLQQDVLQAQVAVAQMTEDITIMEQNRLALSARLNALLGREANTPIGPLELEQELAALGSVDALMDNAVEARPALLAAQERARAAEAGYRAARRAIYPDFTVTLGYGERPQFVDLATVMVGITIPLWAGARQLPLRREMAAMQSMEEARERDLYNETLARISELHAEAVRARNLLSLYADAILPQAQASVESALSAYRVGRVEYLTLVQNQMTVNRYEIQTVRLRSDYHRALAELEALIGTPYGDRQ